MAAAKEVRRQSECQHNDEEDEFEDLAMLSPPDGGWGWIVVFSSFMIHVIADGVTYTFGIFYVEFLRHFRQSNAKTAWILSILVGITLGIGPVSSALTNRYGCRLVTIVGGLLASAGLLLSIFAPTVEVLYLTVGVLTGGGFGFMYLPAIVSVSMYFEKKRAFATGIAVCGSGVGTFGMAPLLQYLVDIYSWKGALLIAAGIVLNCLIFGALFRPLKIEVAVAEEEVNSNKIPCNGDVRVENCARNGDINTKSILNRNLEIVKRVSITPADSTHLKIHGIMTSSNDIYHSLSSLSWQHQHGGLEPGPLHRKDVLYGGSLLSLPQYKSSRSLYTASLASIPKFSEAKDGQKAEWNWLKFLGCSEEMSFAFHEMLDLTIMKEPIYIMFVISNFMTSVGFNVPFVYTKDRAIHEGISSDSATLLLSVIGISNMLGRIVIGYISDKSCINRVYLYNVLLTICGVCTAFSFVCDDFTSMAAYCSIFGITAGAYVGLTSVILADLFGLARLTNGFGLLLLFQGAASFIGPPIAGWLYDVTRSYDAGYQVAGTCIAISGLMLFFIPVVNKYVQKRTKKVNKSKVPPIPAIVCLGDNVSIPIV